MKEKIIIMRLKVRAITKKITFFFSILKFKYLLNFRDDFFDFLKMVAIVCLFHFFVVVVVAIQKRKIIN